MQNSEDISRLRYDNNGSLISDHACTVERAHVVHKKYVQYTPVYHVREVAQLRAHNKRNNEIPTEKVERKRKDLVHQCQKHVKYTHMDRERDAA